MNPITEEMQQIASELLTAQEVKCVLGWEKGTLWYQSAPAFIFSPDEASRLVWDEFCLPNLSSYLLDDRYSQDRVAIFVKGCDSRGIVRLLSDQQLSRQRVYLIGVPCPGMKDPAAALGQKPGDTSDLPVASKCRHCTHRNPVLYDRLLGQPVPEVEPSGERFAHVDEIEKMGIEDRYAFWEKQFARCIRCFACRNVCPACNCTYCCFDLDEPRWLDKEVAPSQNAFYALTRAFHVAGRCVECGECERVCPMGIPIMALNRKIIKDINELFGDYEAGLETSEQPPLGRYNPDDPDNFA